MTSKPFITCLWFDNQGEEAARFYASVFKNSHITAIQRHTDAGPGPGRVRGPGESGPRDLSHDDHGQVRYRGPRTRLRGRATRRRDDWRQEEEAPRTDWESWPLVAWTSQTTVCVPAVQSP